MYYSKRYEFKNYQVENVVIKIIHFFISWFGLHANVKKISYFLEKGLVKVRKVGQ